MIFFFFFFSLTKVRRYRLPGCTHFLSRVTVSCTGWSKGLGLHTVKLSELCEAPFQEEGLFSDGINLFLLVWELESPVWKGKVENTEYVLNTLPGWLIRMPMIVKRWNVTGRSPTILRYLNSPNSHLNPTSVFVCARVWANVLMTVR